MAYIKRKGIRFSITVFLFSGIILGFFYVMGDWDRQFTVLTQYNWITNPIVNTQITIMLFYLLFGLFGAFFWYIVGKYISPIVGGYFGVFFGGITAKTFIDENVNKQDMSFFKFAGISINTVLILFSIDFFFSNTILYVENSPPSFQSFIYSFLILTLFQSLHLVYNNVGMRSYNKGNAEVIGISGVLDRLIFRLLSTGGLLGVFASISFNNEIIDQLPAALRIIFVRSAVIGILTMTFWFVFFQPQAIVESWKKKRFQSGKTKVEFN